MLLGIVLPWQFRVLFPWVGVFWESRILNRTGFFGIFCLASIHDGECRYSFLVSGVFSLAMLWKKRRACELLLVHRFNRISWLLLLAMVYDQFP